ncbi:anaphase-promoting complex subunit 10-like, partial [Triticum aestivum]|uniref:anaphase-promoting complex subunit 10-like n=1 Tax=Triticum aestivum TaxID=4565 RepID=UPI001D015F59
GGRAPAAPLLVPLVAPTAGRLKGCPELTVEGDMREMAKMAAWSVSSCKPGNGVASIRDDSLNTYWQSVGPHLVNTQFQKKVQLQLVVLYVDFKLDESYTPSKISIRVSDDFHNLKVTPRF